MRIVLQRVLRASVSIEEKVVGQIDHGFVLLVGVGKGDSEQDADILLEKICKLRLFPDAEKSGSFMEKNIGDVSGGFLIVSQFTLFGDMNKGTRPSFSDSAPADEAEILYNYFVQKVKETGLHVATGMFGAHMMVDLVNDGPVTLLFDSRK